MNKVYKVRGMTCNHCKEKIEKSLQTKKGIKKAQVNLKSRSLNLDYDEAQISLQEIKRHLVELGYELTEEETEVKDNQKVWVTMGVAIIVFLIVNSIVPDFSTLLTSGNRLGLVMLFVIGITTSFHCVSMCGGIAVSQVIRDTNNLTRNIMYNLGRVISYTLLGGIVGALGSGITLGNRFFAIIPIILGILMILIGLSNAGIISLAGFKGMQRFNLQLARIRGKLSHDQGPFVLGLVNGLMPCGPLQLMQIYALSTGSFVQGALAMLTFSLGTVPLMLGLGVLINKLSITSKELVFKMGGYLVILLGASMMMNGLATAGVNTSIASKGNVVESASDQIIMKDGYQIVTVDVEARSYENIVVQKDVPVKLIMNVEPGKLNGCNYAINIPQYDIFAALEEGQNVFEFMPIEAGTFMYSCWMGMIRNTITVVDGDISGYVPEANPFQSFGTGGGFRCH